MLGVSDDVSQERFLADHWGRKAALIRADPDDPSEPRFSLTMGDLQTIIKDNPKSMVSGAGFKFASNGAILGAICRFVSSFSSLLPHFGFNFGSFPVTKQQASPSRGK